MSSTLIRPLDYFLCSLGISCMLPILSFMNQTMHERVELICSVMSNRVSVMSNGVSGMSVPASHDTIETVSFLIYYSSFVFILRNYAISVRDYEHLLFLWSYWVSLLDLILLYRKFTLDMIQGPVVDNLTLNLFITMFMLADVNLQQLCTEQGNELLAIGSYVFYWFV